jgi:DNA-binding MarR family transcriptional regulator
VSDHFNERLAEVGITVTQLPILAALCAIGGMPVGRLAEIMALDPSTLTRNLSGLTKRGWVRLSRASDRRVRNVELTESGGHILSLAYERWRAARDDLSSILETRANGDNQPTSLDALLLALGQASAKVKRSGDPPRAEGGEAPGARRDP